MDVKQELDLVAREYATLGKLTFWIVALFLVCFAALVLPAMVQFAHELPLMVAAAEASNAGTLYVGLGGMAAAAVGVLAALLGPALMFLVARFLRRRTHYLFCKRAVMWLSFYRPSRPALIEKTLTLLEQESVRSMFK